MATPILGVRIDTVTKSEALDQARSFLVSGQHALFTPNPEMLVKADSDSYFKEVLNRGDLNLCDGFGLWLVMNKKAKKQESKKTSIERITGVDFMLELCKIAAEQGGSVFLLGGGGGVSDAVVNKTKDELLKKFSTLQIVGVDKGFEIKENFQPNNNLTIEQFNNNSGLNFDISANSRLIEKINQTKPDIVFVAFGMGKQEKWIVENLPKMPSVKIAMGVGGSFDYISGSIPRAPLLMRKIGLEWLYRLYKEPKRIGRIWNATFTFIWLLITKK